MTVALAGVALAALVALGSQPAPVVHHPGRQEVARARTAARQAANTWCETWHQVPVVTFRGRREAVRCVPAGNVESTAGADW
ncbi:MAG: hypothetical protein ACRDZR_02220 [Acidimicrobiales bacterium]